MLLNNYEVRIYARDSVQSDDKLEEISTQSSEAFYRLINILEGDSRIKITVTEV